MCIPLANARVIAGTDSFPLECARRSLRRPVAVVHNVPRHVAQEERDVSLADAVPPRRLLDLDCYLY